MLKESVKFIDSISQVKIESITIYRRICNTQSFKNTNITCVLKNVDVTIIIRYSTDRIYSERITIVYKDGSFRGIQGKVHRVVTRQYELSSIGGDVRFYTDICSSILS